MASLTSKLNLGSGNISGIINLNNTTISILGSVKNPSFTKVNPSGSYTLPSTSIGQYKAYRVTTDSTSSLTVKLPSDGTYLYTFNHGTSGGGLSLDSSCSTGTGIELVKWVEEYSVWVIYCRIV